MTHAPPPPPHQTPTSTNPRRLVIFTGQSPPPSTIETIEAIADAFPTWQLLILQNAPRPLPRAAWLRRKLRRLRRQPLSYPLELLTQAAARLRLPSRHKPHPAVRLPRLRELQRPGLSLRTVDYRSAAAPAILERFDPWLGLALAAPILPAGLFNTPALGTLNVHKSLLPDYRGMPPGFWELHDGADTTGVSLHWVAEGLDTGPIAAQIPYPLPPFTTPDGIGPQLDERTVPLLLETLRQLDAGQRPATPQPPATTSTRSRPALLTRRRVERRCAARRRPRRSARERLRHLAKTLAMFAWVHVYAPLRNLARAITGRAHVCVLLYHRVDDHYLDDVSVGVGQFRRQLDTIRRHYDILDLPEFLAARGRPRRRPAVVITFDDGYACNHLAARLLRRAGIPATFFVSTGLMESTHPFDHDQRKLGRAVPSLNWAQIREMAAWGFHIGSHTASHADLGHATLDEARTEIDTARATLIRHTGHTLAADWLAYPFGGRRHLADHVRGALPDFGITCCLSAYGGVNGPDFEPLNIRRQGVDWKCSLLTLRALIEAWPARH